MQSHDRKPRKRKRSVLAVAVAAVLLLLALLFRDCLGLFGVGTGDDDHSETAKPQPASSDARDAGAAGAQAPPRVCVVALDANRLTVDGKDATVDEAVRICRAAGRVSLSVTGDARTGTYNELVRALQQAGVEGVPPPEEL